MRHSMLTCAALAASLSCCVTALAVPAKPGVMHVETADGSTLAVRLVGDEYFHQYFTEDGYPLTEVDGNFYYCDYTAEGKFVNSGIKATEAALRDARSAAFLNKVSLQDMGRRVKAYAETLPRRERFATQATAPMKSAPARKADSNDGPPYERGYGLFPDLRFPAYGNQKAIVILVEYQDTKFRLDDPHDYFSRMLNETGFSDLGGTGCAKEYFSLNSNGNFNCDFDVYGPVTLSKNMSYYGGNNAAGNDMHPADMVKEACEQLDDEVDFSEYDRNHDGVVDNVFVFYAGRGEASGGAANTVWPHSWSMTSAGYPNLYFDGVRIHTYGCSNEWEGSRPDGVGTFIHEFSHVMGLPDLYATSYSGAFTPGGWSALDYGPYNNGGMTPPLYSVFERYALGWIEPKEILDPADATLPPIGENVAGIIHTPDETEFFLVENRQQTGWDKYIPGHGMLVWHVDYDDYVWSNNTVNDSYSHQYVDIEEADGTQNENSRAGDAFPGTSGKTEFTADTRPAMRTWDGTDIDVPLTEIAESEDGIITFKIKEGASELPALQALPAEDINPWGFTANWTENEGHRAVISVFTLDGDTRRYVDGYEKRDVGRTSQHIIKDLEPSTTYYYTVASSNGWNESEESEPVMAATPESDITYFAPVAAPATDITKESFTANWEGLEDAESYTITVYTKHAGEILDQTVDFTDGLSKMPEGWVSTSTYVYASNRYSGESAPSLRMTKNGDTLTSPEYPEGISKVSFWTFGVGTHENDEVRLYGYINGNWNELSREPVAAYQEKTLTLGSIPAGTTRIRIEFVREGTSGSLAVDDVTVYYAGESTPIYLDGLQGKNVGQELSFQVTGLQPGTAYYYKVQGQDGELLSQASNEIGVNTRSESDDSGIIGVNAAKSTFRVSGRTAYAEGTITAYDPAGRTVATGRGSVVLPSAGCYIIRTAGATHKVIVK